MTLLTKALQQHPDQHRQIVLQDGGVALTRAALLDRVCTLAEVLVAGKIRRLALHADNGVDWVVGDLACQQADILCVPLPLFFTRPQLLHALHTCGCDAVLTAAPEIYAPHFGTATAIPDSPLLLLQQPDARTPLVPPGTGKVTFTSGSTGTPRGVCLSTQQQMLQAQALAEAVGVDAPRHLCVLPLSTLLENLAGVYAPLLAGGSVAVRSMAELGFAGSRLADPRRFLETLATVRPATLILIPQLLQLLVQAVRQGWQAPPLQFVAVGGSRVAAALITEARALGLPVYEGYGLSECASVVSLNTPAAWQTGSCGKPLPHLSVSIEEGEIQVSGNSMLGYVDEPATWFRKRIATGDQGYLDTQGFVHIDGRSKNVLISSYGRNISPEWVESELLASPLVAEAVVFGDARPHCVALLTPARSDISDRQLQGVVAAANARLPDYAQVKQWLRLSEPLACGTNLVTTNGRPRRARIAHAFRARIAALYRQAVPAANEPLLLEERLLEEDTR